jgi:hypothetical protein
MSYRFHCVCAFVLLAAALVAQEPGAPTFDSSTKLVLIPFHVERGKYFAADLQASDFILREDGHPRPFTVFEGPNSEHPLPLELILLFDTTPKAPEKDNRLLSALELDPKADYEFLANWDESVTREVLQKNGMDVRLAVYHYTGQQLERLCAASSDPREIVRAFHALLDPIPQGKGELTLLPDDNVIKTMFGVPSKNAWLNESIVGTLKDAAGPSSAPARRMLILFTVGSSGTGSKSAGFNNIVDPALAMRIPIDSVVMGMDRQEQHVTGTGPGAVAGALETADPPKSQQDPLTSKAGAMGWYKGFLPWITKAGELTGGEAFVPHHLDREALAGILGQVRDTALSQYVVGFSPDAGAKPKKHSLAVALSSKSKGKLVGGDRDGVIY